MRLPGSAVAGRHEIGRPQRGNGEILLWDLTTGKRLCPPEGHQRAIGSLAFSPDGKTLATGSWDETLRLWDAASGKELHRFQLAFSVQVAFTPGGKTLAGSSSDGYIRFFGTQPRIRNGIAFISTRVELIPLPWHRTASRLRPLGRVGWNSRRTAKPWFQKCLPTRQSTSGEWRRARKSVDSRGIRKARQRGFCPDGRTLVSVSSDKTARLWDTGSGKEVRQFHGHKGWLGCVAYSPDGKTVAAAGEDKLIHLSENRHG